MYRKQKQSTRLMDETKKTVRLLAIILYMVCIVSITTLGCSSPKVVFFPVQKEILSSYPKTLGYGRLAIEGGSLGLRSLFPAYGYLFGASSLVFWPYGYSLRTENNKTLVINSESQIVAQVGEKVRIGGGLVTREVVKKYLEQPLLEKYHGPYFITSGVITSK